MTLAVILAAGEGTRLRPLTEQIPKTLVALAGRSLLARQLAVLRVAGIADISIVTGHCADALSSQGLRCFHNPRFASTNMVASLSCARDLFDGAQDVVVAYGDIAYEPRVLAALLASKAALSVVVDLGWLSLWQLRMDNPLSDAETMKLDTTGHITELGRKPHSLEDIQGQYIGLIKVSARHAPAFFERFDALATEDLFDGRPPAQMYMTSYLQDQIDQGVRVQAVPVQHGWLEVDSVDDLRRYEAASAAGVLSALYNDAA